MKGIEIKSTLKFVFQNAVKSCGLEVEELKKCKFQGRLFYCISRKMPSTANAGQTPKEIINIQRIIEIVLY
jgi:hypothetical protein